MACEIVIDIPLLIAIAEIKKKATRHGSMSQRWWQNRIYGLQFGDPDRAKDSMMVYVKEAIFLTQSVLIDPRVSRAKKNNLRGYLNGLRDAKLAIEQRQQEGGKSA